MKRILIALLAACLSITAGAQNFTSFTGSNIQNAAGQKLGSGQICALGTDAQDRAINFTAGGGGVITNRPVCKGITNGVIAGGYQLANPANTSPAGILYHITIKDSNTQQIVYDENCVSFSGAAFNLDAHTPVGCRAGVFSPPSGSSLNGPFTVNGNFTWTGMGVGNVTGNLTGNADTATTASKVAVLDKGFYNVVTDCGVDPTGIISMATGIQACNDAHPGAHFVWPPGTYKVSASILPKGQGVWYDFGNDPVTTTAAGTVIIAADAGVTPFVLDNANAGGARLSGGKLVGQECYSSVSAPTFVLPAGFGGTSDADGIRVYAGRVTIDHVLITCFGRHGINIDTTNYSGNANVFRLDTIITTANRGSGVHIQGVDSNAGVATRISSTGNQLDGINDESFLGNTHIGHHTDLNGFDFTTGGSTVAITNSVISNNYATVTAVGHGLAIGDYVIHAGTSSSRLNGRFHVLDVPTANTYIVWSVGSDRASAADTGTVAKTAGSGTWKQSFTGCSINNASASLTCTGGGFTQDHVGMPINVPGAGAAGANLVSWISLRTSGTVVTLRDTAGTTVAGPATSTLMVRGVAYRALGAAQFGGLWLGMYSEASQNPSMWSSPNQILGGDQGALVDHKSYIIPPIHQRTDASGFHSTGNNYLYDSGTGVSTGINFVYRRFGTGSILRTWQDETNTEKWREVFDSSSNFYYKQSAQFTFAMYGAGHVDLAPNTDTTNVRLCRQPFTGARTGCKVQAFGNIIPDTAGGRTVGEVATPFSAYVFGPTANNSLTFTCTGCSGNKTVDWAGVAGSGEIRVTSSDAAVDLASVATGACTAERTVAVTGAAFGDAVNVTAGTALEAGTLLTGKVTSSGNTKWQFCNLSGGAVDRASDTYTVKVIK
jgi:hypothetical protein